MICLMRLEAQSSAHVPNVAGFEIPGWTSAWKENILEESAKVFEKRDRLNAGELPEDIVNMQNGTQIISIAEHALSVIEECIKHFENVGPGNPR